MNLKMNISFWNDEGRFFGPGPYRLLKGIESVGSLRAAAKEMELSYSKALSMVQSAESALGFALIQRKIGGKHGGGSCLTAKALELIDCYEQYIQACNQQAERLYDVYFEKFQQEEPTFNRQPRNWEKHSI